VIERDIAAGVAFVRGPDLVVMELGSMDLIMRVENLWERAMSSGSVKLFEEFAQDCVRLAQQADTPELRAKLLNLADEWMRAVVTSRTSS
jgi:hypothetical protein